MIQSAEQIIERLHRSGAVVLVTVDNAQGSTPREVGAKMVVFADNSFTGTIGGGTLEWLALAEAQKHFQQDYGKATLDWSLGPNLGQCCGGRIKVSFEKFVAADTVRLTSLLHRDVETSLYLFGAGHVGRALVLALAPLPFRITWIDTRPTAFPTYVPANVEVVCSDDSVVELREAPVGTLVCVMTHSHAIDMEIVAAALGIRHIPYIGLIGSETKRARFTSQLKQAGCEQSDLRRLICPIGLKEIKGKEASTIAASIAVQLLLEQQRFAEQENVNTGLRFA